MPTLGLIIPASEEYDSPKTFFRKQEEKLDNFFDNYMHVGTEPRRSAYKDDDFKFYEYAKSNELRNMIYNAIEYNEKDKFFKRLYLILKAHLGNINFRYQFIRLSIY